MFLIGIPGSNYTYKFVYNVKYLYYAYHISNILSTSAVKKEQLRKKSAFDECKWFQEQKP